MTYTSRKTIFEHKFPYVEHVPLLEVTARFALAASGTSGATRRRRESSSGLDESLLPLNGKPKYQTASE